ncbi:MAG: class I SAM-dependent methyltransferase, partial [Verrucomicrobiota bacterium]
PRVLFQRTKAAIRTAYHQMKLGKKEPFNSSAEYKRYLKVQLQKTVPSSGVVTERIRNLTGHVERLGLAQSDRHALCIGCRNTAEIDRLTEAGYGEVTGVDLFSIDPRIKVMDMHALTFPDDSFDLVYTCHNLEHSYDVKVVVGQIIRVLRHGGAIAVETPLKYTLSETDRNDFETVEGLLDVFSPHVDEVLFKEEANEREYVGRAVFKIKK